MHAKCVIKDNDELSIQFNKTYLALANKVGGLSNLSYSEKGQINPNFFYAIDVNKANKFRSALWVDARCRTSYEYYGDVVLFDTTYSRNNMNYHLHLLLGSTITGSPLCLAVLCLGMRKFEYTSSMFREVQQEFRKKGDCLIHGMTQEGDLSCVNVDEQCLLYGESRYCTNIVDFDHLTCKVRCEYNMFESRNRVPSCYILPRWSKNVQWKHTYIKSNHDMNRSNESHNLFRGLCSHFFIVAQDFVTCDEEANMLNSALDNVRAMLIDYRDNLGSKSVASTQNSMAIQYECMVGPDGIEVLQRWQ
ncbi:uncharacterized protein LOC127747372 [Arachis duranensis]|uniref:Protein FAR1-RELATED SEQUENCE n=1 Tax=Arachis duranensis TaxID=130453 RepID=A0A9C6TYH6_ARADU|nr:uncharacterized protein LOC127747372 [Arachis duranensis]